MASAKNIGKLYAELSVQDKMSMQLAKAGRSIDKFASKFATLGKGLALAAPAAAVAGLTASMKGALDAGGKLSDLMARTGASGEWLFIMQRAFENTGLAAEKLPVAINKLQQQLTSAKGASIIESLGLDAATLAGGDPAEAFRRVADAIGSLPSPTERAARAMDLFGRSGGELLVLFTDKNAFATASKQVGGLGQTLAANAERFDRISDSATQLGLKTQQAGAEIASALLPALEEAATALDGVDLGKVTKDAIGLAKAAYQAAAAISDMIGRLPQSQRLKLGIDASSLGLGWANNLLSPGERAQPLTPLSSWNFEPITPPNPPRITPDDSWENGPSYKRPNFDGIGPKPLDLTNAGIPGLGELADIVDRIKWGSAFERVELPEDADPFRPWESSRYDFSDMQRRGFGFGGEGAVQQARSQVEILERIHDVLRDAKIKENVLTWAT